MKYLFALLALCVAAFGQSGTPNFSTVRATTGTFGAVTGTGTIAQLTLANGTAANATFQLSSTGTLTIDPSGVVHRVYIPGEFYTDFAQITTLGDDLPSLRLDHVTLETGNAAEFTAPALTTGNIVLMSATGTGSGNASALRLVNTRSGSGTNVGLTINATGAGARAIDIESGAINLGSGVTIGTGTAAFTVPTANGTNGQLLTTNGSGGTSWTTVSGGTGGGLTMGGTSGQVLYNNAGAIGSVPGLTVTGTAITATGMTLASGTTQLLGSLLVGSGTAGSVITGSGSGVSVQSPVGNTSADTSPVFRVYAGKYSRLAMTTAENGTTTFSQGIDMAGNTLSLQSSLGTFINSTQWTMNNATTGFGYSGATGLVEVNNGTQGNLRDLRLRNVQIQHATLASGTSASVDFGSAGFQSVTATGTALVLTGTGYPSTGTLARSVTLFITAGTAAVTLTTGTGWRFVGTGTPSSIAANKIGVMALTATGSTGATVRGSYSEEP